MSRNASARYSGRYYASAILAVAILGSAATFYTYRSVTVSVQASLLADASAVAYALQANQLHQLTGSEEDLVNPVYQELKDRLIKIRSTRSDIRFVYITGYRDDEPFFYVDSEPEDSGDYSPPGQVYEEGTPPFREPFIHNDPTAILEGISSDRWGTWLTAVTPVTDPETERVIGLVGMDMDASQYYQIVLLYTAPPLVSTIFVVLLLIIGYAVHRREQRLLDVKAEIVAIASHEIRTPLTGISWIAESLLKQSSQFSETQRNNIALIGSETRDLLLTVNEFLDLTTLDKGARDFVPTPVPLLLLMTELVNSFAITLREKSLELRIDPSLTSDLTVQGDLVRLKRLFANLISNAIKYSKANGVITIGASAKGGHVTVSVRDQGIGIDATDLNRIFGGYYRSKAATAHTEHGTGLGLRYVAQIVKLHKGRVWVESKVDKGSTFFVELPS